MRRWTGPALVQVMVCRLSGAKPLPESVLTYCQLDPWERTSMKFESKYKIFHSWNCAWICRLRNSDHVVQGRWVKENWSNHKAILHIPSQLCCIGMCKVCLWSDGCKRRYKQMSCKRPRNLIEISSVRRAHKENMPSAKLPQMRMSSRGNVPNFSLTPIWPGYPQLGCYQ